MILGFPSNDFGGQEPGTPDEIAGFCKKNYGVTFPMFSKLVTKAGSDQSPIYTYLGKTGSLPGWNFAKYLRRQERQGDPVLRQQGDAGSAGAALGDRRGARGEVASLGPQQWPEVVADLPCPAPERESAGAKLSAWRRRPPTFASAFVRSAWTSTTA